MKITYSELLSIACTVCFAVYICITLHTRIQLLRHQFMFSIWTAQVLPIAWIAQVLANNKCI